MSQRPVVSVVMPIYNSSAFVRQALDSVVGQTFRDLEVVCVDDGSTDGSADIVAEYASRDGRVRLVRQGNAGAGAARNAGTLLATGTYVHYLDSDDWLEPDAYERIVGKMEASGVDVCMFQKITYDNVTGESEPSCRAFRTDDYVTDFDSYPSFFIHNAVVPWNKLVRREVIVGNGLRFDEIPCANDRSFYFALVRCARSIMVCRDQLIHYRVNNPSSLVGDYRSVHYDAHFAAFDSTMSHFGDSDDAVKRAVIDVAMVDMFRFYDRARVRYKPRIYGQLHDFLSRVDFSPFDGYKGYGWWGRMEYIRGHPHGFPRMFASAHLPRLRPPSPRPAAESRVRGDVVVSLTSYPARIGTLHIVVESLLNQTVRAGRMVLWLSEEQFPGREADLPGRLLALRSKGLEVRFREGDLKPHKKYIYAVSEFPDSVVITVDDDVVYPRDTFEALLESYRLFPKAVSAMRVHRIALRGGRIAPYEEWWYNDDTLYRCPSMQAMATGVGGILYPPGSIPDAALDPDAIAETCLFGDDLWLKFHEASNGVPTVLAAPSRQLDYVDGTQEEALWIKNKIEGMNDTQIWRIGGWFESRGAEPPERAIASGCLDSGVRVSFLWDCRGKDCAGVRGFLESMPGWGELVCYDLSGDGSFRTWEAGWWDGRLLVLPALDSRTPLYTVAGCSRGDSVVMVDPSLYSYGDGFFDAVMEASSREGRIVADDPRMAASTGSSRAEGFAFDPMSTVLRREELLAGRFYHVADALSSWAVATRAGLPAGEEHLGAPADPGLYNEAVLRSVAYGLGESLGGDAGFQNPEPGRVLEALLARGLGDGGCEYSPRVEPPRLKVCPVCGGAFRRFLPGGSSLRDDAVCPGCGSMERNRAAEALMRRTLSPGAEPPRVLYVNPPAGSKPSLKARGMQWTVPSRVLEQDEGYDAIVMCHQLQRADDREGLLRDLRSRLSADGTLYLTVPLKKAGGRVDLVEGTGKDVFELMEEIAGCGYDAEIRWMREVFSFEVREMHSMGNEAVIVCRAAGPGTATDISQQ